MIRRAVPVDEPRGWRTYFCNDSDAMVVDVLRTIADRFSLETAFREVKQVVGIGKPADAVHPCEH